MSGMNIQTFLENVEEYKMLFKVGQETVPLLEELFNFIIEIDPLLIQVNDSIVDYISSMPIASTRLSKVTEATEMASNEIMNLVDRICINSQNISDNLKNVYMNSQAKDKVIYDMYKIIKESLENNIPVNNKALEEFVSAYQANQEQNPEDNFKNSFELLDLINYDATSIMMSLQVQDITSQQIASVNHILIKIQTKFSEILEKFNSNGMILASREGNMAAREDLTSPTETAELHRTIAFDKNDMLSKTELEIMQDDIDAMFANL